MCFQNFELAASNLDEVNVNRTGTELVLRHAIRSNFLTVTVRHLDLPIGCFELFSGLLNGNRPSSTVPTHEASEQLTWFGRRGCSGLDSSWTWAVL